MAYITTSFVARATQCLKMCISKGVGKDAKGRGRNII